MSILILIDVQYLPNAVFSFEKTKISISMKIIPFKQIHISYS